MNNLTKTPNGFILNEIQYQFQEFDNGIEMLKNEILSEEQAHIGTDNGVILLDVSCTIENQKFENIEQFLNSLYL